jgi:hypothetical protein
MRGAIASAGSEPELAILARQRSAQSRAGRNGPASAFVAGVIGVVQWRIIVPWIAPAEWIGRDTLFELFQVQADTFVWVIASIDRVHCHLVMCEDDRN